MTGRERGNRDEGKHDERMEENREAERGRKGGIHENPCAALSLANVVVRDAVGHIGYDLIVTRQHRSYDNHNIGQDSCHYWG